MERKALSLISFALALSLSAAAVAMPPMATGLSSGHRGGYSWAVALESRESRTSADRGREPAPCLRVAITLRHGPHAFGRSIFRDCGIPAHDQGRGGPPLVAGGSQLGRSGQAGMTVIGVVATAPARAVRVAFSDGTEADAPLTDVGPRASGRVGRRGVRYAVLTLPGAHCIERLNVLGASGRALWTGPPEGHSCSA